MAKRKPNSGTVKNQPAAKLYGAPPPLSEDLIRRLQGAVDAARQTRPTSALRPINPFRDSASDEPN